MPTPNEWNPNTTTVYSSSGSAKEIPLAEYDKFIGLGWDATAPSAEAPETEIPKVEEEAKLPSPVEIPKDISTEQLEETELPGLMAQNASLDEPWYGLKDTFGEEWTPPPIFEQLGLVDQGIYGAVRVKGMIDTYTIGPGGRLETPESFQERFGTLEQAGIVNEVSMEEAIKLGIVIGAESIVEPLSNKDPYEVWAEFRDEEKEEIDTLRTSLTEVTQTLIDQLMGYGEAKAEAKEEAKEELGVDEKSEAISNAQKVRNDLYNSYEKLIVDLSHSTMTTAHIGGLQARARAQRAVEIAPLDSNVLIAQGAYDRAKDLLDDWSDDYNEAMTFQMQAAQLNINMMEGELNREQQENLAEAQIKFDIWQAEFNRNLDTQDEVKKLMLMFPEAGVSIADSWEDAYKKISPYVQDEKDFEQKIKDLELKIAEKALAKPYWKATDDEDIKIVKWTQKVEDAGLTGLPQSQVDDIFNLKSPPNWFNKSMEQEHQMSKDWQDEWTEERDKVIKIFSEAEDEDEFSFAAITKGARNAGMSVEEFKKLSIDEQNMWMEEF